MATKKTSAPTEPAQEETAPPTLPVPQFEAEIFDPGSFKKSLNLLKKVCGLKSPKECLRWIVLDTRPKDGSVIGYATNLEQAMRLKLRGIKGIVPGRVAVDLSELEMPVKMAGKRPVALKSRDLE